MWMYELGPDQLNEVPILVTPVKLTVPPEQTGLLLDADAVGFGLIVTDTTLLVPVNKQASVTVT